MSVEASVMKFSEHIPRMQEDQDLEHNASIYVEPVKLTESPSIGESDPTSVSPTSTEQLSY